MPRTPGSVAASQRAQVHEGGGGFALSHVGKGARDRAYGAADVRAHAGLALSLY